MPELAETAEMLRAQAERCRRLARGTLDYAVIRRLLDLAEEFENRAAELEEHVSAEGTHRR
jgi:hypothetical protein